MTKHKKVVWGIPVKNPWTTMRKHLIKAEKESEWALLERLRKYVAEKDLMLTAFQVWSQIWDHSSIHSRVFGHNSANIWS